MAKKVVGKAKPAPKKVAPKKVAPKKAAPKAKKEPTRVYHVAKREDGKWQVKFAGGDKAIKLFDTKVEAEAAAKEMAKNQNGAVLTHASKGKSKGKIQKK